jgi:hypothetical protein
MSQETESHSTDGRENLSLPTIGSTSNSSSGPSKNTKSDDRAIAEHVLKTAIETIMRLRRDQHGDAENTFNSIGQMWTVYLQGRYPEFNFPIIKGYDVSQMMVLLKIVRSSQGDQTHLDHYVDQAGYSGLAAMLGASNG